jgi:putative peptidoglycan lipid II flippase
VALNTAWTLMFFALGVVAQSVGTAVFPTLAALAAAGDFDGFRARLAVAMRGVLFLALPSTIGLIALGEPVIRALFERGAWTGESTSATAWALGFFALGIAGHSLLEVLSRAFYALSDTLTPVLVGVAALLANIALSMIFVRLIGDPASLARGPFAGLALANALTTLAEGAALWWLMRRRVGGIEDARTLTSAARALIAALAMGIVIWAIRGALTTAPAIVQVILAGGVGAACYFALAGLFGVEEARTLPSLLLARLRRA